MLYHINVKIRKWVKTLPLSQFQYSDQRNNLLWIMNSLLSLSIHTNIYRLCYYSSKNLLHFSHRLSSWSQNHRVFKWPENSKARLTSALSTLSKSAAHQSVSTVSSKPGAQSFFLCTRTESHQRSLISLFTHFWLLSVGQSSQCRYSVV